MHGWEPVLVFFCGMLVGGVLKLFEEHLSRTRKPSAAPEPEKKKPPRKVRVMLVNGNPRRMMARGISYPSSGHLIVNDEGLVAVFAPGQWMYAELDDEKEEKPA